MAQEAAQGKLLGILGHFSAKGDVAASIISSALSIPSAM